MASRPPLRSAREGRGKKLNKLKMTSDLFFPQQRKLWGLQPPARSVKFGAVPRRDPVASGKFRGQSRQVPGRFRCGQVARQNRRLRGGSGRLLCGFRQIPGQFRVELRLLSLSSGLLLCLKISSLFRAACSSSSNFILAFEIL